MSQSIDKGPCEQGAVTTPSSLSLRQDQDHDQTHRDANDVVLAFLVDYEQPETQRRLEQLASLTKVDCEKLLKVIGIKGVVQCRVKQYSSLERKLEDLSHDTEFRDWLSSGHNLNQHQEMGDLAGIRIGLYLPGDVAKVAHELQKRFHVRHLFGTVTGGRDVIESRNLDVTKHMEGRWHSRDGAGTDEYWEFYGYKSWQMVAEWKAPPLDDLESLPVEIQVGTVVTQAWAEVQHNIIYKNPDDIVSTMTMRRIIDAMNGLAITTEIMLKELERSLELAKIEAEETLRKPFNNGGELLDCFRSTYLNKMRLAERQRWNCRRWTAETVILLCYEAEEDLESVGLPSYMPNRPVFKELIQDKDLLHAEMDSESSRLDISVLLLKAMNCAFLLDEGPLESRSERRFRSWFWGRDEKHITRLRAFRDAESAQDT